MKAADYRIINGAHRDIIDASGNIYIEFINGSGYGGQSYYCQFASSYKVYREKWGQLIECGIINETTGTDKNCFSGNIDGKVISCDFLSASEVFTRIEKLKTNL